jgi:hypothetical protein
VLGSLNLPHADERTAAKVYEDLRTSKVLGAFLRSFPKRGDLHNHMGSAADKSPLLHELVEYIRRTIQQGERELLERRPAEAAAVRRRYIMTVGRNSSPQDVFWSLPRLQSLRASSRASWG